MESHEPGGITLSEISQAEKHKYCVISLICRKQTNKTQKQKPIDTKSKLGVAHGWSEEGKWGDVGQDINFIL